MGRSYASACLEASSDFDIHRFSDSGNYIHRRRDAYPAGSSASDGQSQELGSVEDYLEDDPSFAGTYKVPLIGIEVSNGRSELKSGVQLAGIEIHQIPDSPGAAAGLQGRQAAVQIALVALTWGLFFPPAAVLGAMVMKRSGIGQSHELIIAVDAQRTYDVGELESALGRAEPGETDYLTVVSGGRREQVRMNL
jgi:S1-C subfamily serine protease